MKSRKTLTVELLEARDLLATFGVPWPNAKHLTFSLVPDGTTADGTTTNLFQTLDSRNSTIDWASQIARALQTWASQANINVGFVDDNSLPLGVAGPIQTAPGVGDIRVTAHDMASDIMAFATPYDLLSGSRSGDVILNSTTDWGIGSQATYDLYTVLLHEFGHTFGLDHSTDQSSPMYESYQGVRTGLISSDISNIRALYGTRQQDSYEGFAGNNTLESASVITDPAITGDITTLSDVDYYQYTLPASSGSTAYVTVQTAGVSLLESALTVYDSSGQVVGTSSIDNPFIGSVVVQISNATPGQTYYIKVQNNTSDVFGIGSYRLKIDSGPDSEQLIAALDAVYNHDANNVPAADHHTNDTVASATDLTQTFYQADGRFHYTIAAGIEDSTDVDYNKIVVPYSGMGDSLAMQISVAAWEDSSLAPKISVYDQNGNFVPADILANGDGSFLAQVAEVTSGATYYVKVSSATSDSAHNTGNYLLGVNFSVTPLALTTLLSGSVSKSTLRVDGQIDANETQATHFTLTNNNTTGETLRFGIFDANDNLVLRLVAGSGETVSATVFLPPARYKTRALGVGGADSAWTIDFTLKVDTVTDPIDPPPADPGSPPTNSPPIIVVGGSPLNPPPDP